MNRLFCVKGREKTTTTMRKRKRDFFIRIRRTPPPLTLLWKWEIRVFRNAITFEEGNLTIFCYRIEEYSSSRVCVRDTHCSESSVVIHRCESLSTEHNCTRVNIHNSHRKWLRRLKHCDNKLMPRLLLLSQLFCRTFYLHRIEYNQKSAHLCSHHRLRMYSFQVKSNYHFRFKVACDSVSLSTVI